MKSGTVIITCTLDDVQILNDFKTWEATDMKTVQPIVGWLSWRLFCEKECEKQSIQKNMDDVVLCFHGMFVATRFQL